VLLAVAGVVIATSGAAVVVSSIRSRRKLP
jgi:hypothetical protein